MVILAWNRLFQSLYPLYKISPVIFFIVANGCRVQNLYSTKKRRHCVSDFMSRSKVYGDAGSPSRNRIQNQPLEPLNFTTTAFPSLVVQLYLSKWPKRPSATHSPPSSKTNVPQHPFDVLSQSWKNGVYLFTPMFLHQIFYTNLV